MMQFSINSIDLCSCCFATHVIQMKNLYYHRNMTKSVSLSCSTTRNTFDYMHLLLYQLSEHPETFPTFNISSQFNFVQHCFFPCFQLRNLVWHVQDSWSFSIGLRISSLNVASHHLRWSFFNVILYLKRVIVMANKRVGKKRYNQKNTLTICHVLCIFSFWKNIALFPSILCYLSI